MRQFSSDIALPPAVKVLQSSKGSRASYARLEQGGSWETTVTPDLEAFLADLDMFYLGVANAEDQLYAHSHQVNARQQDTEDIEQRFLVSRRFFLE